MPSDKRSSHPLSEKLLFAEGRDHYRNPQLVKCSEPFCEVPSPNNTSTTQLGLPEAKGISGRGWRAVKAEEQEVCGDIYDREATAIKSQ